MVIIRFVIFALAMLVSSFAFAGGAGGSWGDGTLENDPYTGSGGSVGGGGAGGSWEPSTCYIDPYDIKLNHQGLSPVCNRIIANNAGFYNPTFTTSGDTCSISYTISPTGSLRTHNYTAQRCSIKPVCKSDQVYDPATNSCIVDPKKCLSPNTLINGVCVPPKQPDPQTKECPMGYTLTDGQCVKDPPPPCDPAVQECNPDGTAKCDCCEKLETIIGNQGIQISLHNKTNQSLSAILAQQQTTNLKIDGLGQKLDAIAKAVADSKVDLNPLINKVGEAIANDTTQATKLGQKLDAILLELQKPKTTYDDTKLRQLIAKATFEIANIDNPQNPYLKTIAENRPASSSAPMPASAVDLTDIMAKQDDQISLLQQIRDLFKEDTENPTPPPEVSPEEQQSSSENPLDKIKNYDISQNRFSAGAACPANRSFQALGSTFTIPFTSLCDVLSMLGGFFVALAYLAGGIIIVKCAGGN